MITGTFEVCVTCVLVAGMYRLLGRTWYTKREYSSAFG